MQMHFRPAMCAPDKDTTRTSEIMKDNVIMDLFELLLLPETERIAKVVDRHLPPIPGNDNKPKRPLKWDERGRFVA